MERIASRRTVLTAIGFIAAGIAVHSFGLAHKAGGAVASEPLQCSAVDWPITVHTYRSAGDGQPWTHVFVAQRPDGERVAYVVQSILERPSQANWDAARAVFEVMRRMGSTA